MFLYYMTLLKNPVLSLVQRHMIWIFRQLPTSCQRLVGASSIDCVLRWLIETSNSAAVYLCQTSVNGWQWGGGDRRVPNRLWQPMVVTIYSKNRLPRKYWNWVLALPVPVVTSWLDCCTAILWVQRAHHMDQNTKHGGTAVTQRCRTSLGYLR